MKINLSTKAINKPVFNNYNIFYAYWLRRDAASRSRYQ